MIRRLRVATKLTTMSGLSDAAREHGYYERFIPVWNPNESSDERTLSDLTIGIIGDEQTLTEIDSNLVNTIEKLGQVKTASEERSSLQTYLGENLRRMLRNNVIEYAHCDNHEISSVGDLESRLDDDDFEVHPL